MLRNLSLIAILLSLLPTSVPARPRSARGASDADAYIRVLSLENRRVMKDKVLAAMIHHSSRRVAKAAVLALGRLGDESAVEALLPLLNRNRDPEMKKLTAFALSLITDEAAQKIITQHLAMQKEPEVLAALYLSLGRAGDGKTLPALTSALVPGTDARLVAAACQAIGMIWAADPEPSKADGELLARITKVIDSSRQRAEACAFALSRFKGEASSLPVPAILEAMTRTSSEAAKAFLVRTLGRAPSPLASALVLEMSAGKTPLPMRIEAVKALASLPFNDASQSAFRRALSDAHPAVVFQALDGLTAHGTAAASLAEAVEAVHGTTSSSWLKGASLKTLAYLQPVSARGKALEYLKKSASPIYAAAAGTLALVPLDEDFPKIVELLAAADVRVPAEVIDALGQLPPERLAEPLRAALKRTVDRADAGLTAMVASLVEKHKWKDFAPNLATAYGRFTNADQIEPKIAVLNALGALGDLSQVPFVIKALDDPERLVVVAAVDALKVLTGKDESARIPRHSATTPMSFSAAEVEEAVHARVAVRTTRGTIYLKMRPEAPLNALNFLRLVRGKFYDGKTFHRIVPGFVVQGGDPRGDGYGGPGFVMRDEVSPASHERGTVGLATAGRDTGGCQFFVNLAPNLHLDGRYTMFAEVTKGLAVAEKLEAGDKILSARVL